MLSIGQLREAIEAATSGGAAWGTNLHPSKGVMVRIGERTFPLIRVSASVVDGQFCLLLDGGSPLDEADSSGHR